MAWRIDYDEKAQDLFYLSPGRKIYVAPTYGSDGNAGTKNSPMKTFNCGYAQLRTEKNDTLFCVPGASPFTSTASKTISLNNINIVGLAPNQRHSRTAATDGGAVAFRCVTSDVDSLFNITGNSVRMYNIETMNSYSSNANRCDIRIAGRSPYFEGCGFRGGNGASQLNHADGGVGIIFALSVAGAGNGARFKDCHFGNSSNDARSLGASWVLYESGGVAGYFNEYIDCVFDTRIETTSAVVAGIVVAYLSARYVLFRNCFFYNFWQNHVGKADYVIYDQSGNTHDIVLMNSAFLGFTAAANTTTYVFTNTANAASEGGKCSAVDVS